MMLFGVLLAVSLVTLVAVLVSAEMQARAFHRTARLITVPLDERERFERLVGPLRTDPDFGRLDR